MLAACGDSARLNVAQSTGVAVGRDGSLLVADDVGNSVWRVSRPR